jgi:predicted DNA-binding transcriptional regulator AlpA
MVAPKKQLVGISGVETITDWERSTIRRKYLAGKFPKPRYYGTRRMWLVAEIEEWIASGEVKP